MVDRTYWPRCDRARGLATSPVRSRRNHFHETVAQAERDDAVMLSGKFGGGRVAYLDTARDLGVTIEIFGDDRSVQ
jgi:hypothetical protein